MISCLTISNRPEWHPWCRHQVAKQVGFKNPEHIIVDGSQYKTIGEARSVALAMASQPFVAWFDDDDWSHPERLRRSARWLFADLDGEGLGYLWDPDQRPIMVGNSSAWLLDARLKGHCALHYPGYGQVIFNGGVFSRERMPQRFLECNNGEDFEWVKAGALQGACVLIPELQHAWLCHGKNIVNTASRLIFEHTLPGIIQITDEERKLIPV